MTDPIIGIDLGTSNTVAAHADGTGPVQVITDEGGGKIHPSVVSFHPSGGVVVGAAAKQRKVIDPQHTIYSVKRLIGRGYRSPEVQTLKARVPFEIKEGDHQLPMVVTRGGEFAIPEISAIVLDHMRELAAARLGTEVSRAVITVPASFDDAQRSATATAGAIAGLTVVRVLNEPTAAALAYGHTHQLRDILAVYDFGGGTFDVSILKLDDQVYEVLGTAGDSFLGGDDLDERLVETMAGKFLAENLIDLRTDDVAMMRLRAVAEQTKIELSRRARAVVRVDEIAYGPRGVPLHLQIEITRDELVREIAELVDRTFPVCREAQKLAGVTVDQISDVLLVGGTTRIPYVREQVGKFFEKAPRVDVGAEEAVAVGAALQAASIERILARPRSGSRPPSSTDAATSPAVDSGSGELRGDSVSGEIDTPSALTGTGTLELDFDEPRRPASEPTLTRPGGEGRPLTAETAPLVPSSAAGSSPPPPPVQTQTRTMFGVPRGPNIRPDSSIPPPPPPPRTSGRAAGSRPPGAASSTLDIPTLHPPTEPGIGPGSTQPTRPIAGRAPNPMSWGDQTGPVRPPPRPPPQSPTAAPGAPTLVIRTPAPSPATKARGGGLPVETPAYPNPAAGPPRPPPGPPRPPVGPPSPPVVLEVTPRSLGIGTVAGYCEELIRRNSRLPTETRKLFTTARDRQDVVRIVVCQGESRRIDQNVVIGDLVLQGLPPRPRGETSIEVTFAIDASGVLQVHARDALTGAEQRAELDLRGGMQPQDVAASRDRLQTLRR